MSTILTKFSLERFIPVIVSDIILLGGIINNLYLVLGFYSVYYILAAILNLMADVKDFDVKKLFPKLSKFEKYYHTISKISLFIIMMTCGYYFLAILYVFYLSSLSVLYRRVNHKGGK